MKTLVVITLLALAALLMWIAEASSQSLMCGPYKEFVKALEGSRYGEARIGKGLSGGGTMVIETFVGKETFTILATQIATGKTCIIAAGGNWVAETEIPGEPI